MRETSLLHVFRYSANLLGLLIFIGYVTHFKPIPILQRLDNLAYDLRLQNTLSNSLDQNIVILDIDENSLAEQGHWPWSRDKLARMVDILFSEYEINLLAFDIVFSEPDNTTALPMLEELSNNQLAKDINYQAVLKSIVPKFAYDEIFANSLKNRAIVLSFFTSKENIDTKSTNCLPPPVTSTQALNFAASLPEAKSFGANLSLLQQAAVNGGYFNNTLVDADGVYRRIPLLSKINDQVYEALALAIYHKLLGLPAIEFITDVSDKESAHLEGIRILDYTIPTDASSAILVPYRGKQKSFTYYSASDVINHRVSKKDLVDKIVLVGTTAAGLMDLRSTPVQNVYPGVEIHANILSGLLNQTIKSKPNYMLGFECLELLWIFFFSTGFFSVLSPRINTLVFFLLGFSIISSNFLLWTQLQIDSLLASPLLLLIILYFNQFTFGYFLESKRKKQLSKVFGLYIPPELVNQMVQSGQDFSVTGESRDMTVMFCDIRGFSTISEGLDPHELCELINEVFSPITEVIHQNQGTIDKYIGDAIMAFWGAPLHDEHHADHAINAALNVIPALREINWQFSLRGWPEINVGIGISSGKMSVGNMGSNFRMAYTVMGDSVNLGSRLEGLTKRYGVAIIVSELSKKQAPEYIYRELDRVTVKGKRKPLTIYEPIGKINDITPEISEQLALLDEALTFYRICGWEKSEKLFQKLHQRHPDDLLYKIYLSRIEEYKILPPPDDWAGVFVHANK